MNKLLGAAAAAYLASGAVVAQPELELFATTDAQVELVQQITELRAQGGPTPEGTIDPLRALAMLYQEAGNDALAIVALEEARHVTRVHHGLSFADEALLLRQEIRSERARGNHERVWDLEQAMMTIARQNHADTRILPIFRELAEDRLAVSEKVDAGERPPMIFIGCYYGAPAPRYDDTRGERPPIPPTGIDPAHWTPSCRGGTSERIIGRLRSEILMYYADAIEIILRTGDYASPELRQLENAALRIRSASSLRSVLGDNTMAAQAGESGGSFTPCFGGTLDDHLALEILDSCLAPVGRADDVVIANVGGQASLIRLISYEIRSDAPAADRTRAIVELADWHLVSTPVDRRHLEQSTDRALTFYERAYRELRQGGDVQMSTMQIFSPELPVALPTFEPNPFAPAAMAESSRYIDVAFAVTKYGRGEQIEILDSSKDATRAEERDLIRLIESTSFRPRVVDGELAASARVVVRYHLGR